MYMIKRVKSWKIVKNVKKRTKPRDIIFGTNIK